MRQTPGRVVYIHYIIQSTSPPTEVGIIIPQPYESKESHLWLKEIRRGNGGFRPRNRTLTQIMVCKPAGFCATEMWKPPGPGACSLFSLAVAFLSSTRKNMQFYVLPTSPFETSPSLWRKTSCPPSVKIRKLSATSLANYKTPISTRDLSESLTSCQPFWMAFMVQGGVVTGPCHYHRLVLFLSCFLDLTRAFYDLFLYNTQKERLKSNTRLKAGVRLATIILRKGPGTAFIDILKLLWWWSEYKPQRTGLGSQEKLTSTSNVFTY